MEHFSADTIGGTVAGYVRGEGQPVLLLHGGPGLSCGHVDGLGDELVDGYRVANYQQRGLPPGTAREPYDVGTQVEDVVAVLDQLGWSQALIVGHSWGGHLLLHVLATHPDRVAGALVVDPLGGVGDGGMAGFGAELASRMPAEDRARAEELDRLEEEGTWSDDLEREQRGLSWPSYFANRASAPPMPEVDSSLDALEGTFASLLGLLPGLADRLRSCPVPTRFVHGRQSPMPITASSDTAELLGAPVDVIEDCGHFTWLEQPGAVRRSLDRLVDGNRTAVAAPQ